MRTVAILLAVLLTGCAGNPPRLLAEFYDRQDPCQARNNGGNYPSFCGAGNASTYIYDMRGNRIGYTKSAK